MGQGERIEIIAHCPLTPSSKRSLIPQGIKKSLNLHFGPNPILVTVSLALILMAIGPVIFWMLIVLLKIPVTLQLAGAIASFWILSTLPLGLILIAQRMGKRVSMASSPKLWRLQH